MKQNKKLFAILTLGVFIITLMSMVPGTPKDPWKIPGKYKKMENPTKSTKENLKIGKTLYSKHCKSCHGKTGAGDGTKARELKTEMWELGSKKVQSFSDGELYYMTYVGRGEMAGYDKKIKDEEDRWSVINYIRTFAK